MDQLPDNVPERSVSHKKATTQQTDSKSSSYLSPDCPFCTIISHYPSVDPLSNSSNTESAWSPDKLSPPAYVVLSTEHVIAFLDIAPLTRGHVLVCPKRHKRKVGDLEGDEMSEIGRILPLIARAVIKAVLPDIPHSEADYNIVQNNGPGAAQVVPHVHFHIVPRPPLNYQPPSPSPSSSPSPTKTTTKSKKSTKSKYPPTKIPTGLKRSYIQFGRGVRHELDDDDAWNLVERMRDCVAEEWRLEFGGGMEKNSRLERGGDGETRKKLKEKL